MITIKVDDDMVGKRMLLTRKDCWHAPVQEFQVLEVSPSGTYVKLINMNRHATNVGMVDAQAFWCNFQEDYSLIEVLE